MTKRPVKRRQRGAVNKSQVLASKTRSKQLFMVLLIWIAVLGFGMLGFNNAKKMFELDVQSVQINGEFREVEHKRLAALVSPLVDRGFFTVDLAAIKQRLESEEWVYSARVKRRWPSGIAVSISEQKPIAVWNSQALLNADGQQFALGYRKLEQLGLPRLVGLPGQQARMMQHYQEFSRTLEPLGYSLDALEQHEVQGMTAVLDNGIEIRFGNEHLLEKMQQFLKLHKRFLKPRMDQLAYIDFRYQRGAALRWNQSSDDTVERTVEWQATDRGGVI